MQRQYRLTNPRSFDYIYKHGKCVSDNLFTLVTLSGKYPQYKVGFVTGKKVGKSVMRNKVRRRMREAFRQLKNDAEGFTSYILVAHASAATATFDCVCDSVRSLLDRAGKLKK